MQSSNKWYLPIYILVAIIYLQIIFNVFAFHHLTLQSLLYIVTLSVLISGFYYLICNIFKSKVNHVITYLVLTLTIVVTMGQYIYNDLYKSIISVYSIFNGGEQVFQFINQIIDTIIKDIWGLLAMLLPLIILIVFDIFKVINYKRVSIMKKAIIIVIGIIFHIGSLISFNYIGTKEIYSNYNLYHNIHSPLLTTDKLGLLTMMRLDIKRSIFGFEEKEIINKEVDDKKEENVVNKEIEYNVLDIDFDSLIANEKNATIKAMDEYFKSQQPTEKNEYTGMFKGKNLIVFVAEAFSQLAINEQITPTLYKLYQEGFQFDNFYTPIFPVSTADGEYITDTSLIPKEGVWSLKVIKGNYMPYSYANVFEKLGYTSQAYHNHSYSYYKRHIYMETMGYDSYRACGKGLNINCKIWPESDLEMMQDTVYDYINDEHFIAYYMTVSGHLEYNRMGNKMVSRNWDAVKDLPYSSKARSYLAANMELDKAVAYLIEQLKANNRLDDTVIAISGDHYPYGLTVDEMNELSTYTRDENFEVHHMAYLLWNSEMKKPIKVTKYASSLDVLPTILNLFGIEYDSRLLMGTDILSNSEPLVIFSNRSFITDKGRYNSIKKKFIGEEVPVDYVETINLKIYNKYKYSRLVLEKDYYRKLYERLGWIQQ